MTRALPLLLALSGCKADPVPQKAQPPAADPYDVVVGPYDVMVRWTAWGVPHILAEDSGSLGYGMGYAFARDNGCVLADQILFTSSQRARYLGAGEDDEHLNTDLGWLALGVRADAESGWFELAPELQETLVGYAAGYNRYLEDTGSLPGGCAGEPWVQPIDHIDLATYYIAYGLLASGGVWVSEIGSAQPPGSARRRASHTHEDLAPLEWLANPPIGSNGWAIGAERSANGHGMLLSNTHFPSLGEKRWHESQLTIPGELDVYGASLMGVPVINVGFNRDVAWTHTVSSTPRFTAYLLDLDPEDPTRYLYDGKYQPMEKEDYSVEVLNENGTTSTVKRTLYRSHYGPVIDAPVVGWSDIMAITFRDANADNVEMAEMWRQMNTATSLDEFQAVHRDVGAIPWVHTMAADAEGQVWYADSASTPRLSQEAYAAYEVFKKENVISDLFGSYGVYLLDGSDPVFEWEDAGDTRIPGLVPLDEAPQLQRSDFVFNANDNHWLANPSAPLEGYPAIYGDERSPRTPRTRMNARYLAQIGPDAASGEDGLFTLAELQTAALGGRGMLAELLQAQVVAACQGADPVTVDVDGVEHSVDLEEACAALAAWDGTVRPDAQGAHLWREALGSGVYDIDDLTDGGRLFALPFDADDPVDTPATLKEGDRILEALATAVVRLDAAGLALDAPLGEVQFQRKETGDIPIMGGQYLEGVISVASHMSSTGETLLPEPEQAAQLNDNTQLTAEGYQINNGNSWVMAMSFTDDGPQASAVMAYSQSLDPDSPHYADQSELYSTGTMRAVLFEEADILADPELEELHLVRD